MEELAPYFRALADRKRLQIVQYLAERERMTVTQLGEEMRLSQPLVSWHLRILRKADVVSTRRQGRQVWCSLNRAALARYQHEIDDLLGLEGVDNAAGPERPALKAVGHQ